VSLFSAKLFPISMNFKSDLYLCVKFYFEPLFQELAKGLIISLNIEQICTNYNNAPITAREEPHEALPHSALLTFPIFSEWSM
jgi:hypothetical protein